jgi:hypothetical protein
MTLDDVRMGARFVRGLAPLLRAPLDSGRAKAALARRLARREDEFLAPLKHAVYEQAQSPYHALLRLAGCEYADLRDLVRRDGVEGALRRLLRHGVYLTVEEFKGRRSVQRGSARVEVAPLGLRNPRATAYVQGLTSGSRGPRSAVPIDVAYLKTWAENLRLQFEARGGLDWRKAYWAEPGGTSIAWLACYAGAGVPLARWFSPIDPRSPDVPALHRVSARLLPAAGRLAGARLPRPEHAPWVDRRRSSPGWRTSCAPEARRIWSGTAARSFSCPGGPGRGSETGGGHQLVEQEDRAGRPVLRLLVHPRLGPLDAGALVTAFLEAVASRSDTDRVMGLVWRDADLVAVERRPPLATASGKILHLHVARPGG